MLGSPSVDAIVEDRIYLGNLLAATCEDTRNKLGITHILSVCPDYPSTGPNHLVIAVDDSEYEDLLIHLPEACRFIQSALEQGGKVLVHCFMGISRSTTVVCAYLMKTGKLSQSAALRLVKQHRPIVHPNYGFLKQLDAFASCDYDPCPTNTAYTVWKKRQEQDVTGFLNKLFDTTPIILNQLHLSSEFPSDPEQAQSLLADIGITHLLSLSPAQISSTTLTSAIEHCHINISNCRQDGLLVALPDACSFIDAGLKSGGQVLVHCLAESKACMAVCAYLMYSRKISSNQAYTIVEEALPLFNPTRNFLRHLELFESCGYAPTSGHPLVLKEWPPASDQSPKYINGSPADVNAAAVSALSNIGCDVQAFAATLAAIQSGRAIF